MIAGLGTLIAIAVAATGPEIERLRGDRIAVTIVVVHATTKDDVINPKLETMAKEVRKREPELTGFRIAETLKHSIPIGSNHVFDIGDKQTLKVTVEKPKDKEGRVGLTISPPGVGDITYTCMCEKFFPVVTPKTTENGDRIIIAVMAKPCKGKKGETTFP